MEKYLFLKSVELYGFKSFADKTRLEFSSGTTSLLGPNGCGKSNIVDAIKWVLGEQSTKTLRAGKMEDIIFNGTETRKPLNVAEVSLVVNNEDGMLPIEHTEVEIKRRIYRSGESEFFINKNQVRLRDVRELFYDTGVGKSAYSILEQGKIDQILSHKPEDRRYIFEEAAGITRYKSRSLEASRKLQRTEENIEQVETLFKEIKRQYESRKTQAAKVRRYRELDSELSLIEVDVQFATIKNYQALAQAKQQELQELENSYEALKLQSAELRDFLEEQQTEVRSHVENRINMQSRTQHIEGQLNGKHEQIALLQQRYADFLHDKDESLQRANTLTARLEQYQEDLEDQQDVKEALEASIAEVHTNIKQQEELTVSTASSLTQRHLRIAELEKEIIEEQEKQQKLSTDLQILTDELVKELDQRLSDKADILRRIAKKQKKSF
ncbi:MAG: chromosome segregation SMC family protein [Sphaerochaetaceae bacterium]